MRYFIFFQLGCHGCHGLLTGCPRTAPFHGPDEIEQGLELEKRFRRDLGVWLVFRNRVCPPLGRGEKLELGEWLQAALEYDAAEKFRRELADKSLSSQLYLARQGFSTGGRSKYGLQRWLVTPDRKPERALADGEYVRRQGYHVVYFPRTDGTYEVRLRIKQMLRTLRATEGAVRPFGHD